MKAVYLDSSIPEKKAKEKYRFPEFIMMENAAMALESALWEISEKQIDSAIILCGTGNNGGDGYALARRIYKKIPFVQVVSFGEPRTSEAALQKIMALSVGADVVDYEEFQKKDVSEKTVVVDCIYGTGFHGELKPGVAEIIDFYNGQNCFRLACDIPSGINRNGIICTKDENGNPVAFCGHKTVTMGALKTALYSDMAKDFTGSVEVCQLGISDTVFESCGIPDAQLIEECDIKLPVRQKKSSHKGNFGHAAVVLGEKQGAGIIAGTAALRIGTGLVSLVETENSSQQFMMNPELMIAKSFPEKTTAVLFGSGFGRNFSGKDFRKAMDYIFSMKNPAAVLDADFFYCNEIAAILKKLNSSETAKVILTPHPKELVQLLKITMSDEKKITDSDEKIIIENRFEFACLFAKRFPNITLISKGANTIICSEGKVFICDAGSVALAKAGSGDVLAGMCAGLLAQGYSAKDAAITAVYAHGKAGAGFANNWECTPLQLIEKLQTL